MTKTKQERWLLGDPATTLSEILRMGKAELGRTIIAYVGEDPEEVLGIRSLPTPEPYRGDDRIEDYEAMHVLSTQVGEIAEQLVPPRAYDGERWSAMHGTLVTVVCRDGYVVSTDEEMQFYPAWLYSNHLTIALAGDVFAVTPHGWTSTLTEACGLLPTLPRLGLVSPDGPCRAPW